MKDCIVKKKVRKVKTRKEKHKRKSTKGNTQKVKHKRKSHKGKNNPSWLLLFVPVFIKISKTLKLVRGLSLYETWWQLLFITQQQE